jgi:hypothetical protein
MRQKSNSQVGTYKTTISQSLQKPIFANLDLFCGFGAGLAIGTLIGLTYSCVILMSL